MVFTISGTSRTITEEAQAGNPPLVEYSLLSDLFVELADWHAANLNYRFPLRQIGGDFRYSDNLGSPVFSTIDIFLQNQAGLGWRLRPANYPHTIVLSGANLLAEDSSAPIWDFSALTSQVIVIPRFSDLQVGYQVSSGGGGGSTPAEIWNYSNRSLSTTGNNAIALATQAQLADEFASVLSLLNRVEQGTFGRYQISDGILTFYGTDNVTVLASYQLRKGGAIVTVEPEIDERRVI